MKPLIKELHSFTFLFCIIIVVTGLGPDSLAAQKSWSLKVTSDFSPKQWSFSLDGFDNFIKNSNTENSFVHFFEIEKRFRNNIRTGIFIGYANELYRYKNRPYSFLQDAELSIKNVMAGAAFSFAVSNHVFVEVNYAKSFYTPVFMAGQYTLYDHGKIENLAGRKLNTVDGDIFMLKTGVIIPFLRHFEGVISAGRRLTLNADIIKRTFEKYDISYFVQGSVRYYFL